MSDAVDVKFECRDALNMLERVRKSGRDAAPLMREIAGIMVDEVEQNFEKEGRPKWPGLASSTIRQRRRKGNWPGRILQMRGRLATSIQQSSDSNSAVVGTNVRYARIQHMGGTIRHAARERIMHFAKSKKFSKPKKANYAMKTQGKAYATRIPARPFLRLGPTGGSRILAAAEKFLASRR